MKRLCEIVFNLNDSTNSKIEVNYSDTILIDKNDIPEGTQTVEIYLKDFNAIAGEEGFYILPNPHKDTNRNTAQSFFRTRENCEYVYGNSSMPIFAVNHGNTATLAVVKGMSLDYSVIVGVKDGCYYMRPKFFLDGKMAYENIEITFFDLAGNDADFSGIARRYRKYQLDRGACIPIKKRMDRFPVVGESLHGPCVRLRMAWKQVPPPVLEQTEENEPPVHVAITFNRAKDIVEEFHRQGIKHAEFCLVGWNKSGHDGRFPDLFPVEPLLGTEDELKQLIEKTKSYGYLISAHTNVYDSYTIAKRWKKENMLLDENGEVTKAGQWGGGQSYLTCPKAAHENYIIEDMADMERLGFRGTHYLDVMTILPPSACCNPLHPLNRRQSGEWRGRTMAYVREKVGASGSEGAYDFCIGDTDYVLYTVFNRTETLPEIFDCYIPFWHIVYHGIVSYNSFTDSVNAMIKDNKTLSLNNYEYGGRPLAYFYAKFLAAGDHWMGSEDLTCHDDKQLESGVRKIKEDYDLYCTIRDLQLEFMDRHEKISDDMISVTYSNGSVLVFNKTEKSLEYQKDTIPPFSFKRFDPRNHE